MTRRPIPRRSAGRRRGLTLLETILSLAVGAVAVAIAVYAMQERTRDIKAQIAGAQFTVVQKAAAAYLEDNFAAVDASIGGAGKLLIDDNGNQESTDELIDRGYLPQGWGTDVNGNPYAHDYQIWVKKPSADPGFEALLVTTGDRDIPTTQIATAALSIGGDAGFVNHDLGTDPDTITGLYGSWSASVSNFRPSGSGSANVHIAYAMAFSPDTACGEQLYRVDVPGCKHSNVVENVTAVFDNDQVWTDSNGNGIVDPGEKTTDPDKAIGLEVKNNAFIGGDARIDGLLVVNSYLEQTKPQETCSGNLSVPNVTQGNVFHYKVTGSCQFQLPQYVLISDATGIADTVNSLTLVVEVGGGVAEDEITFSTADSATIDWGFGDGTDEPDNCATNGEQMIYQFLRFSQGGTWLSQLVWQECS